MCRFISPGTRPPWAGPLEKGPCDGGKTWSRWRVGGAAQGPLGFGRGWKAGLSSLTFSHILLTLAHIHVDEFRPLHAEGEEEIRQMRKHTTDQPAPPAPQPAQHPFHTPLPPEEGKAAFSSHCLGQEGLARARGTMEQKT